MALINKEPVNSKLLKRDHIILALITTVLYVIFGAMAG